MMVAQRLDEYTYGWDTVDHNTTGSGARANPPVLHIVDHDHAVLMSIWGQRTYSWGSQLNRQAFFGPRGSAPDHELTSAGMLIELISSDEKDKLERFASLEENWDSYGARAVTNIAITIAAELLGFAALINHTPAIDIRTHTFFPLADGGLQIGWSGPGGELDVEISPDGDLGYLFDRAGNEYEFDNVDAVTIQRLIASVGQEQ